MHFGCLVRSANLAPDLYPALMSIDVDRAHFEVHADGGDVCSSEDVIDKTNHQRALPHAGISNDQNLEGLNRVETFPCRCHI